MHRSASMSLPYGIWLLIRVSMDWIKVTWWHHQMGTFSLLLALCEGNPLIPSWRPVIWSFDVFFDVFMNKWLNKQWSCQVFKTPWCSLWLQCNVSSGKGFSPAPHKAITWTNALLLSVVLFVTNFSELWIKVQNFLSIKCILKWCLQNGGHFDQALQGSFCVYSQPMRDDVTM